MSLLADLLSKIKQPQAKREVPPNLKNIIKDSSIKSAGKRKMVLLLSVLLVFVLSGIILAYYMNIFQKSPAGSADDQAQLIEKIRARQQQQNGAVESEAPQEKAVAEPPLEESAAVVTAQAEGDDKKTKEAVPPGLLPLIIMEDGPLPEKTKPSKKEISSSLSRAGLADSADRSQRDEFLYSAREHEMAKEYSEALSDYKRALKEDKNNISIVNNISYIYLQMGMIEESVRYAGKALEINKEYIPALVNMGIASAKQEDFTAADEYLSRALALEEDNQPVLFNLAILYERQGNLSRSAEYYSSLYRLGNIQGALGLARINEKQGRIEEAVRLYRSAYAHESADEASKSGIRQRIQLLLNKN